MKGGFGVTPRHVMTCLGEMIILPKNIMTLQLKPSVTEWSYLPQPMASAGQTHRNKEDEETGV